MVAVLLISIFTFSLGIWIKQHLDDLVPIEITTEQLSRSTILKLSLEQKKDSGSTFPFTLGFIELIG